MHKKEFSERLIHIREQKGYTVEEFGVLAGVGKTSQYNYEKGARKPDAEYFERLALIGCDIQYIITGIPSDSLITKEEAKLIKLYRSASFPFKQAVMRVLGSDLSDDSE
ncbi:hypothetical protein B9T11_07710 [Wohlfahrtiimonas chitiniclastica]|uniref:helix-turn-helix domain-containing protein n=1 Tax=Wohlfahrtiimonas chitiniclastica TaxID=400946 RepID=UPI000B98EDFF|nr:helix-turn-helix transcriptional regulator [Wohlfahrtiimonas chitiniclastica]MBS7816718.1 helix-turn-helix transcriptional regulator [Wohlfahrtiimonas chitiniclastica]MBS7822389.1 helix-turn-helix transcriptional regulator [Wohlfahrtiimonas chitiniclastica]MBS7830451.1 helix-turn-helix transcriptional regulator [Wohlfahrtiimonas chitiniclastica]MBS7832419.1 helix-turn-helix transcriptional regulator [Wohlfahrtiimonas chitiniclastica]OYQ79818.1 hypothetical protein B9T11_07710 [Wohlfahrtiimo